MNYLISTFIIFGGIVNAASAYCNEPGEVTIEFLQKSMVAGPHIYLSDISKCIGSSLICSEATGIDVAPSPAPGRSVFLHRQMIEANLGKEWSKVVYKVRGPESIRVEAAGFELSIDDVKMTFQTMVDRKIEALASEIKIDVQKIQFFGPVLIRPDQSKIEFIDFERIEVKNPDWIAKNLIGHRMVAAKISNPNSAEDFTTFQVSVDLAGERRLPVLKDQFMSGQVVGVADIEDAWVPLRRGVQDYITQKDHLIGKRARQSLAAGEPISLRNLDLPLTVTRNQPVTMIVKQGELQLTARATTLDQGRAGQTVDVMNLANKKRMKARIIDEKTVEAITF